jgi:hypothetical protein
MQLGTLQLVQEVMLHWLSLAIRSAAEARGLLCRSIGFYRRRLRGNGCCTGGKGLSSAGQRLGKFYLCAGVLSLMDLFQLEAGAMVEPLSVAYYGVKRSNFQKGETALVVGAGNV